MDNRTENCRRFPPRSKFNDEESTAVLRLIVEQERLLKKPINPVLNINSDKLKRLPPLGGKMLDHASLDVTALESHRTQRRPRLDEDIVLSRPTLLKGKELRGTEEPASMGRPKVPEIYSTPKIVRPRERERPRASYGRSTQARSHSWESLARAKSLEENQSYSADEFVLERPSNPTPLLQADNLLSQGNVSRPAPDNPNIGNDSDEDVMNTREQHPSYIN